MITAQPHAVPHRRYVAWRRTCLTCGHRYMSDLLLTFRIQCPNGCGVMSQAPQNSAPDIETVTEWATCYGGDPQRYCCPEHR